MAQSLFGDPEVHVGVVAIASNCHQLPMTITSLEEHRMALEDSLNLVEDLGRKLRALPQNMRTVAEKFQSVINSNPGYAEICRVRNTLRGQIKGDQPSIDAEDLSYMESAPITSCEVERTFNRCKAIFRDNRCGHVKPGPSFECSPT